MAHLWITMVYLLKLIVFYSYVELPEGVQRRSHEGLNSASKGSGTKTKATPKPQLGLHEPPTVTTPCFAFWTKPHLKIIGRGETKLRVSTAGPKFREDTTWRFHDTSTKRCRYMQMIQQKPAPWSLYPDLMAHGSHQAGAFWALPIAETSASCVCLNHLPSPKVSRNWLGDRANKLDWDSSQSSGQFIQIWSNFSQNDRLLWVSMGYYGLL